MSEVGKLYVFGDSKVIVTSANLTEVALRRNHEFGFVAEEAMIVNRAPSNRRPARQPRRSGLHEYIETA